MYYAMDSPLIRPWLLNHRKLNHKLFRWRDRPEMFVLRVATYLPSRYSVLSTEGISSPLAWRKKFSLVRSDFETWTLNPHWPYYRHSQSAGHWLELR